MLDFTDKPYQFFPPKPSFLVTFLAKQLNRRFVLPGPKHRVAEIELQKADRILPVLRTNRRCLLLPNHSTHSDPQLMLEVQRRLRTDASTMAAYDVFLRGKFGAWVMQRIGCFSVDREGSDSQSLKCAVDTLVEGKRALTIFPEGNVLLMNDRVAPFLGGAAFIGMRAQKKLRGDSPVYAIPIALKFTHLTDLQHLVSQHIDSLEAKLDITPDPTSSLRLRLRAIGLQILGRNLRKRGFLCPEAGDEELSSVIQKSTRQIVERLETKMELESDAQQSLIDRLRAIRSTIHNTRIDENQVLDHKIAASWADEAMLAMRIISYSSDYISESPTLDRHCETLEKLREDVADQIILPLGPRKAIVRFGEPICFADYLDKKSRVALPELTDCFEKAVQRELDVINQTNSTPGSHRIPTS